MRFASVLDLTPCLVVCIFYFLYIALLLPHRFVVTHTTGVNHVRLGVLCVSLSDSCRGVVLSSHSVLPVPFGVPRIYRGTDCLLLRVTFVPLFVTRYGSSNVLRGINVW